MDWLLPPGELIIMLGFFPRLIAKNLRLPPVLLCIGIVILLLIYCHPSLMLPSRWCKSRKNLMLPLLILVGLILRNNKWEKQSSYHLPIQNSIPKLVLILQKVFLCTDLLEPVKLWWPKLLPTWQLPPLSELLVLSSCKNI